MGSGQELTSGTCLAWPLPADPSCAATARALYRQAAALAGLDGELAYDGVTMASELAANTLHAEAGPGAGGQSELWLRLRGGGLSRELVCEVFDAWPGWPAGAAPGPAPLPVAPDATGGRGLQVVHELSAGRWGHHLARARLSQAQGKAVWFALPAPATASSYRGVRMPAATRW